MSELNSKALAIKDKYIKRSTDTTFVDTRKKRGLQAEINKVESIRRIIMNHNIDSAEMIRMRIELNKLISIIDEQLDFKRG